MYISLVFAFMAMVCATIVQMLGKEYSSLWFQDMLWMLAVGSAALGVLFLA